MTCAYWMVNITIDFERNMNQWPRFKSLKSIIFFCFLFANAQWPANTQVYCDKPEMQFRFGLTIIFPIAIAVVFYKKLKTSEFTLRTVPGPELCLSSLLTTDKPGDPSKKSIVAWAASDGLRLLGQLRGFEQLENQICHIIFGVVILLLRTNGSICHQWHRSIACFWKPVLHHKGCLTIIWFY